MRCEHGYPVSKFTYKCMCEQMNYWKDYNSDESRGKAATSDNFPLRERRLFDVNNTSASSASKSFKDLELEAYVAISKLFLPPEVYEEWFGAKGRLVNWNSGDIRKTPDMPSACARESIASEQIPDIKLPAHNFTPKTPIVLVCLYVLVWFFLCFCWL